MRIGKNPYKDSFGIGKAYIGKQVTVAMLTFIPDFNGYYKERFNILKLSLNSLIAHTSKEIADILVFDNGSCSEVVNFLSELKNQGKINYLILSSENLGYNGALNFIYNSFQGKYLAYSDDDVFFHPGWLEKAIEVHESFPGIGLVSCAPSKTDYNNDNDFTRSLPKLFPDSIIVENEDSLWQKEWDEIFLSSIGSNTNEHPNLQQVQIPLFKSKGVGCFPVATHFCYVLNNKSIELLYPYPTGDLMSSNFKNPDFNMRIVLNKKLDDNNLAKVTTCGMFVEHLGNTWGDRAAMLSKNYIHNYQENVAAKDYKKFSITKRFFFKLMNLPIIGNWFNSCYNFLFDLIGSKKIYDQLKVAKRKAKANS